MIDKRDRIEEICRAVRDGKRRRELAIEFPDIEAKYPRFVDKLVQEEDKEKAGFQYESGFKPEVHVIWGPKGVDKASHIYAVHGRGSVYTPKQAKRAGARSLWWDGYDGHRVILITDFCTAPMPTIATVKRLLDRYPCRLQGKQSFHWRLCETIYITADAPPREWFPGEDDWNALRRRIDRITEMR